jgi:hypothetical protein
MQKPNFLIAAPPYTRIFAGVKVLHELCHELNELGYRTAIIFFHSGDGQSKPYEWAISDREDLYMPGIQRVQLSTVKPQQDIASFLENGIIIYPEIIKGNPIGAKRVCRYVLAKSDEEYKDEYVVAFSRVFRRHYHHTLKKVLLPPWMNDANTIHWTQRKLDATYFGKAPKFMDCFRFPNTLLIERDWPRDQEQLALILKNTRFLYTFDCITSTINDAIMCGCVPIMLHDKQIPRSEINQDEFGTRPQIMMEQVAGGVALKYDVTIVDKQMAEFKAKYLNIRDTWQSRVAQFAAKCAAHFSH